MKIKILIAAVSVTAIAGLIALLLWPTGPAPLAAAGPAETGEVTRQTLADTKSVDGTLGYGTTTSVTNKLSGTITALAAEGATVKRGATLYRVDDQPVVLLQGSLPAYRVLRNGVEGADVKQFEQNLRALGYTGFTVDEKYSSSTASAVKKWQEKLGLPETGMVEPGRIAYAGAAVRVDSVAVAVGDAAQPGQSVLKLTGVDRVVTVTLDVADQRLAAKGAKVKLTLPDGSTKDGTITAIHTVLKPAGNDGATETKIEVTVGLAPITGFDQASVDVAFTASVREKVLTVPIAALLALREGGYGIEIITSGGTRTIAVTTGLFASGRVEISGPDVTEGLVVGLPS
ncbi:peptidoglycan hydrolase-like protein with peptidoglycan-binding domain [Allocatelliglobosispora scoriae]|uniref:Peptidoglycan hydrolase-like protein with peptidoglycan-binding domain n=1 Tax=Allocatelliglobosispora scoriae TaxID=643052 RepID=A0A841BVB1_9ACTN|nr:peptidoglycan-binding protein [Allocatelliglobosispora scoriae]MBB5870691.1 peptidoglycan hydrolase-like protein with peptidoglycan-binding domain [Allocatelliglobosispora scoriae]